MSDAAVKQRRIVHFRGRVQGVGFRYTTQRIAAGLDVVGYVQNLADGRVRVVIEGVPDEIDRFVNVIRAEMSSYIRDTHSETTTPTLEFDDFEIRH